MRRSSLLIFNIFLLVIFLILGGRLWQMQIIEGGLYKSKAEQSHYKTITTKSIRGVIYDRNSRQLVSNRPIYAVAITPEDLPTGKAGAQTINDMFDYLARMFNTAPVVTVIADHLPLEQRAAVVSKLAAILHVSTEDLQGIIDLAVAGPHAADTLLRRDLDAAQAAQIQALIDADQLPGISVMNELRYNLYTRQTQPYKAVIVKRDITYEQMRQIEEDHLRLPGVSVVPESQREYVDGPIFSHILGFDGPITEEQYQAAVPSDDSEAAAPVYDKDDKIGQTGIEASMEDVLRGQKGVAQVEVNANQRIVHELSHTDPEPGKNLVLTIDSALQYSVTKALQEGLNSARVQVGAAVVLKVHTGEVLAMVSLPSYDNNWFAHGISQAQLDYLNDGNNKQPMYNNALSGSFAPGSTFKMITAAAALQEKVVSPTDLVTDRGHIDVPTDWDETTRNVYRCWKADGHGAINVIQALEQSCDVFFYQMAGPRQEDALGKFLRFYNPRSNQPQYFNGLGIARLDTYMQEFGLGTKTGIDLPGEGTGVAPDPQYKLRVSPENGSWALGDTLQAAIGQGFDLVTPLQLANVTAAVANGGTLYKPQVVQQIIASDGGTVVRDFKPEVLKTVPVSAENLTYIRQGMRDAVAGAHGTAKKTNLKGVQVAGKTGTAEFGEPLPGLGVRAANAWFVAFAPYDKPDIAVVVLIKGEASTLEGSTFAVPVARDILKAYFHVDN
jgi:penicillin-binding protein 2